MNVQLVYAPSDTHIWAESFDRNLSEAFSSPAELSRTIAKEVRIVVSPHAPQRHVNPEAHDAYLHLRYSWFGSNDASTLDHFEKAIQLQPDYAASRNSRNQVYFLAEGMGV
jgi:hypothetical protein